MKSRALIAEFIGTFTVVCAIFTGLLFEFNQPAASVQSALILHGTFALILSLIAMTHALFPISGAHFNPAVTLGLVASGDFESTDALGYVLAQTLGAITAAVLFTLIVNASGAVSSETINAISNGYAAHGRSSLLVTGFIEILFMALFMIIYIGATSHQSFEGSPAIAIGLGFAAMYLIASHLSSASLNPARSMATALLDAKTPWVQLWLFWVGPITGGIIGALAAKWLNNE